VSLRGGAAHDEYSEGDESYFTARPPQRAQTMGNERTRGLDHDDPPLIKPFHRTPTGLSVKQLKHVEQFEVNLEGGLDVCLNVEVNAKDPAGITVPYRLLVPKLFYEYEGEDVPSREPGGFKKLLSFRKKRPGQFPPPEGEEEELETPASAGIGR
jgi:hypothetical protein